MRIKLFSAFSGRLLRAIIVTMLMTTVPLLIVWGVFTKLFRPFVVFMAQFADVTEEQIERVIRDHKNNNLCQRLRSRNKCDCDFVKDWLFNHTTCDVPCGLMDNIYATLSAKNIDCNFEPKKPNPCEQAYDTMRKRCSYTDVTCDDATTYLTDPGNACSNPTCDDFQEFNLDGCTDGATGEPAQLNCNSARTFLDRNECYDARRQFVRDNTNCAAIDVAPGGAWTCSADDRNKIVSDGEDKCAWMGERLGSSFTDCVGNQDGFFFGNNEANGCSAAIKFTRGTHQDRSCLQCTVLNNYSPVKHDNALDGFCATTVNTG